MSGHSKWSSIKHKKAAVDAKRGKIFTKIIREITVAAREGGGDIESNPRLRTAVASAKGVNMPQENIQRAIKKGTGELPGTSYEEITYEGFGPGGVAVMVEVMTDNKNRTVAEIRSIFAKNGGNMGEAGCVNWIFSKKGVLVVEKTACDEDRLMTIALDAGAEDIQTEENFEITTSPDAFESVKEALGKNNIPLLSAEITMAPQNTVNAEGKQAQQILKLMESLDDHDDVQNCYANVEISDEDSSE